MRGVDRAPPIPNFVSLRRYPEFRSNYPTLDESRYQREVLQYGGNDVAALAPDARGDFASTIYSLSRATFDPVRCEYFGEDALVRVSGRICASPQPGRSQARARRCRT